jgi:4-azaleucine resistance transporter AzlC
MKFTISGLLVGMQRCIPLAISVFAYGLVFGVLAHQAGLSLLESFLMSGIVNAGASQFVALSVWSSSPPILTIIFTTLIVNARYLLMGAALHPWFSQLSGLKVHGSLFFLGDENWALTIFTFKTGERDAAFLLGGGLALFVAWIGSTVVGAIAGGFIRQPEQWGLDFAFTAVFIALVVGMWRGKSDLLPWGMAAGVSIAALKILLLRNRKEVPASVEQ